MRRRSRRDLEIFSLSFLDCVSCAFGALILLFVISMGSERRSLQSVREALLLLFQRRQAELAQSLEEQARQAAILGVSTQTVRTLDETLRDLTVTRDTLVRQIGEAQAGAAKLAADLDLRQAELDARQRLLDLPQTDPRAPVGLPIEADHVVFLIDTSGSMRDPSTGLLLPYVVRKVREVFQAYPRIQGIQFLDADGGYLLPGSAGRWLPDDPAQREQLVRAVAAYPRASSSNPVPGLIRALRTFGEKQAAGKRVAIYVLGDEFTQTAAEVLPRIDRLNPRGSDGRRPVTINALGFPHVVLADRVFTRTGVRFANLMRELAWAHDGAFVGVVE